MNKTPDLDSCIPFPLDEQVLNDVVSKAKDWALMHGAAMRTKTLFSEDSIQVCLHIHITINQFLITMTVLIVLT